MPDPSIPEIGLYKMRLCRGGPFMPVSIYRRASGEIAAWRYPEGAIDPLTVWPWCARYPIDQKTFDLLVIYCKRSESEIWRPHANPYRSVDYYGESIAAPKSHRAKDRSKVGGSNSSD